MKQTTTDNEIMKDDVSSSSRKRSTNAVFAGAFVGLTLLVRSWSTPDCLLPWISASGTLVLGALMLWVPDFQTSTTNDRKSWSIAGGVLLCLVGILRFLASPLYRTPGYESLISWEISSGCSLGLVALMALKSYFVPEQSRQLSKNNKRYSSSSSTARTLRQQAKAFAKEDFRQQWKASVSKSLCAKVVVPGTKTNCENNVLAKKDTTTPQKQIMSCPPKEKNSPNRKSTLNTRLQKLQLSAKGQTQNPEKSPESPRKPKNVEQPEPNGTQQLSTDQPKNAFETVGNYTPDKKSLSTLMSRTAGSPTCVADLSAWDTAAARGGPFSSNHPEEEESPATLRLTQTSPERTTTLAPQGVSPTVVKKIDWEGDVTHTTGEELEEEKITSLKQPKKDESRKASPKNIPLTFDDPHAVFRNFLEEDKKKQKNKRNRKGKRRSNEGGSKATTKVALRKEVHFADDFGRDIETVFEIEHDEEEDVPVKRALILLLLPKQQIFEHVGFEYESTSCSSKSNSSTTAGKNGTIAVSEVVQQLPSLATDPLIQKGKFVGLVRVGAKAASSREVVEELHNFAGLKNDELLLAVPEGYTPFEAMECAKPVLQNKKILRVVSTAGLESKTILFPY